MQAHRIETIVQQDGRLVIEDVPFHAGETVEVIILPAVKVRAQERYPLRGTVIQYVNPTEPTYSLLDDIPVNDVGPWPENLSTKREDMYGDDER